MQRTNLAPVILQLKALGIDNVLRFSFLSVSSRRLSILITATCCLTFSCPQPPPAQTMVQALELLYALGGKKQSGWQAPRPVASVLSRVCPPTGLDHYGRLTDPMGVRMAEFPLSPMFAKMLLESGNFGCSKEIASIAAMMQIQNVFVVPPNQKKVAVSEERVVNWAGKCSVSVTTGSLLPCLAPQAREHRKFAVAEGDHLTMLNVYEAFLKVRCRRADDWATSSVSVGLFSVSPAASEKLPVVSGALPELQGSAAGGDGTRAAPASHEQVQGATDVQRRCVSSCPPRPVFSCVLTTLHVCPTGDPDVILRCIVSGFFANAARIHHSGSYR